MMKFRTADIRENEMNKKRTPGSRKGDEPGSGHDRDGRKHPGDVVA